MAVPVWVMVAAFVPIVTGKEIFEGKPTVRSPLRSGLEPTIAAVSKPN